MAAAVGIVEDEEEMMAGGVKKRGEREGFEEEEEKEGEKRWERISARREDWMVGWRERR